MSSQDFDDVFRDVKHDFEEQQTQCPSKDEIVAFHEHRLSLVERQYVRDHILFCGSCDLHLVSDSPSPTAD